MKYDLNLVADWGANAKLSADIEMIETIRTSTEGLYELVDQLKDSDLSNEGLVNFVGSITDSVLRLVNNVKVVVVKAGKRSELKYFYESHISAVKRIEGKPIDDFSDVMVDYPTGMQGTYKDAVEVICGAYAALDVLTSVTEGRNAADTILSSMSKGSDSHEDVVALASKVLDNGLKKQMPAMKALRKVFTGKAKGKVMKKVPTLFKTMDELKAARVTMISYEKQVLDVNEIDNRLGKMYESMDLAVAFMKGSLESDNPDDYTPSKKFIKSLMDYIGLLGLAVSNYSEVAVAQMAVEHNLALVYTKCMEA